MFENVIIRVKAQSYVLGLLNLKVASEWIVTAKLGFDSESKSGQNIVHATTGLSKSRTPGRVTSARFFERVRMLRGPELCQAAYMLGAAAYSIATRDFRFTLLNGLQGAGYLLVGLGAW